MWTKMWSQMVKISGNFQTYEGVRQKCGLCPMLLNTIMDVRVRRVTTEQNSGVLKMIVPVLWGPRESMWEKKFQRVFIVCKDFGLNLNSVKCAVQVVSFSTHGANVISDECKWRNYRKNEKCIIFFTN